MTFNDALDSGQYTLLRSGSSAADYLLSLCENPVVLQGTVQTDLSVGNSWASFVYTATSGSYTDVDEGMLLIMSTTNDMLSARYQGRIRYDYDANAVATNVVIYCNEASENFTIGDYFWIVESWDIDYKLSRPVSPDNTEEVDYNLPYQPPEPMVLGLRTAYAGYVDSGTGKLRIAFDVSTSYPTVQGEAITAYQFSFKAGTYTVISGALNSSAVTVDFNPGKQWGKLLITQTNGQKKYRRFFIHAADASHPPDIYFDGPSVSAALDGGWSMPAMAFAGVDSLINNNFGVLWRWNELYGGSANSLYPTNNVAYVGWIQRETDTAEGTPDYSVTEDAKFEFIGVVPRLSRLAAQQLGFINSASPTKWGELVDLTPWRALCHFLSRYTTVANLCDVDFNNRDETYLFPAIATQGGNLKTAIEGIAGQINALLESASDGRVQVNISAEYMSDVDRAALTIVAAFTAEDGLKITKDLQQNPDTGIVDGIGATYNPTNGEITVFTVRAPGIAQGEAQGRDTLSAQILISTDAPFDALTELKQRAGNRYVVDNNNEVITVDFPDGYAPIFQAPSKAQLYTFTVDQLTANGVDRIVYDSSVKWMWEGGQLNHQNENGTTTNSARFRRLLPVGSPGDNTTRLPENSTIDPIPDPGFPAFNFEVPDLVYPEAGVTIDQINPLQLQPPTGQVADLRGNTLIAKKSTQSFLLKNFIRLTTPQSAEVTPTDLGSYLIKSVLFNPQSPATALGAYQLASDGVNSAAWYSSNIIAVPPTQSKGADMSGIYQLLRGTKTAGTVMAYSPGLSNTWTHTFNFSSSDGGFTVDTTYDGAFWTSGVGWQAGDQTTGVQYRRTCDIHLTISSATITSATMVYDLTKGSYSSNNLNTVAIGLDATFVYTIDSNTAVSGSNQTAAWVGIQGGVTLLTLVVTSSYNLSSPVFSGAGTIKSLTLTGTGTDPFGGASSGAAVAVSTNYGASFGAPVSVGTSLTLGGFDTQRAGTVTYAAAADVVAKASTLGGAYSNFINCTGASPVCIIMPYYRRNSITTRQTSVSDPDFIVALDMADSDGGTLYFVDGASGTKHDITPTAGMTFDSANCVTIYYGKYIAVFGVVSGTYKLYTSANAGSSWTFRKNLTTPHFIRGRRNDNSILSGYGQLYVTNGNPIDYSRTFATSGTFPRNMPVTGFDGFDVAG